jgi:hypothetical protein
MATISKYVAVATGVVQNTAAETNLMARIDANNNNTFPGSSLLAAHTLVVRAWGRLSTIATPGTLRMRLYLPATQLVADTTAMQLVGSISNIEWNLECFLTIGTISSSGTFWCDGKFDCYNASMYYSAGTNPGSAFSINTGNAQDIQLTCQFSIADNGNVLKVDQCAVEWIANPAGS